MYDRPKINILELTTLDITAYMFLRPLFKLLKDLEFEVMLGCRNTGFMQLLQLEGITVKEIPFIRDRISPYDYSAFKLVLNLIEKFQFDIIHTHTAKAGFIGRVAGRLKGVPMIIHTVHGFSFNNDALNPVKRWFYRSLEKLATRMSNYIITVNKEDWHQIQSWSIIPEKNIRCIYNAIDIDKFKDLKRNKVSKKEFGILDNEKVIINIGELIPRKDFLTFIKLAFLIKKRFPKVKFLIVGDGPQVHNLKKKTQDFGLKGDIIFTGFRSDIPEILKIADLLLFTSRAEGLPTVVLEAMACSLPVVAIDAPGTREVISHGNSGYIFPRNQLGKIVDKVIEILTDISLAEALGKYGEKLVREKFSYSKILKDWQAFWVDVKEKLNR